MSLPLSVAHAAAQGEAVYRRRLDSVTGHLHSTSARMEGRGTRQSTVTRRLESDRHSQLLLFLVFLLLFFSASRRRNDRSNDGLLARSRGGDHVAARGKRR